MKTIMRRNTFFIVAGVGIVAAITGVVALFASLQPLSTEGNDINKPMVMHIHSSVSVLDTAGKLMPLPTNIGITSDLWKDHSLDQYGMQGMSPLHTHDSTGIIHVESNTKMDFTLGEFLDIWGGIDSNKITEVTSGGLVIVDYANHVFMDGQKITIKIAA